MFSSRNHKATLIAVLACALGLGAGIFAAEALTSAAPDDAKAATTGPATEMPSNELLSYGG